MFKKPLANQLRFSALRSSDRRKLVQEVAAQFPALVRSPDETRCDAEPVDDCADAAEAADAQPHGRQGSRGAEAVPKNVSQAKWIAHGESAYGTLYIDADSKQPVWLRCGVALVPTVYTLWNFPDLLPAIATWAPVVDKLMNGADLMLPGLTAPPEQLPQLQAGQLVAIVSHGSRIPVGVGTMAVNVADITDLKGKGVHMLHIYKDCLWALGDQSKLADVSVSEEAAPLRSAEEGIQGANLMKLDDSDQAAEGVEDLRLADASRGHAGPDLNDHDEGSSAKTGCSQEEMNNYVEESFLQALAVKIGQGGASCFPLASSAFFTEYMLPSRPVQEPLDMKHTKWKKLAKFLKTMERERIIKLKDIRGNLHIQSVNWTHPKIADFVPHKTPRPVTEAQSEIASSSDTVGMEVIILYRPKGSACAIFDNCGKDKDVLYSIQDLRDMINEYAKNNNLVIPSNKRMVKIDPILCDALLRKEEHNTINALPRDVLFNRLAANLEVSHRLNVPGVEPVVRKGEPRPIQILIQTTHGHKIVSRITGLETFLICPEAAAKDLTKACACSVAVNPLPGNAKNPHMELMVQGPQHVRLTSYLVGKGVPKKYIEVLDKTKKK